MSKIYFSFLIGLCLLNTAVAQPFVRVKSNQFIVDSKPYYYVGTNYWYGGLLALQKDPKRGKERLKKELDFLKSQGVTSLRVLVGAEGRGLVNGVQRVGPALQPEHQQFDDRVLESLDYLLLELGKRKMYAVLYLSNNWEWSGGLLQYLSWNNVITEAQMQKKMSWDELRDVTSKFYSCNPCMDDYNKQLKHVLNHYNKLTKRSYINEPAIMAWELANEPRAMRPSANEQYKQWIFNTTKLIKSLDKNHLVTLGAEGEMGSESLDLFKEIHAAKEVDYLTIHIWPKNWSWFKDTAITAGLPQVIKTSVDYVKKHEKIADDLNKPLVIEEFGLPRDSHSFSPSTGTTARDNYFRSMFAEWKRSKDAKGSIGGISFWAFGGVARPIEGQVFWKVGDDYMGDPPMEEQGLNTIFDSDESTWKLIKSFSKP
jgi:mannan endo-1,4-beta-mannosidase